MGTQTYRFQVKDGTVTANPHLGFDRTSPVWLWHVNDGSIRLEFVVILFGSAQAARSELKLIRTHPHLDPLSCPSKEIDNHWYVHH